MIEDKQEGDKDSNHADNPTNNKEHTGDANPGSKLPLSYHLIIKYKQLQVQLILLLSSITYRSISISWFELSQLLSIILLLDFFLLGLGLGLLHQPFKDVADGLLSLVFPTEHQLLITGDWALFLLLLGWWVAVVDAHGEQEICD